MPDQIDYEWVPLSDWVVSEYEAFKEMVVNTPAGLLSNFTNFLLERCNLCGEWSYRYSAKIYRQSTYRGYE